MTTITDNTISSSVLDAMNGAKATAKSTADAAQDRFMTLLVTQMKNQDPLNPLDNAQVTSQLAQLSTVTGIDKLNSTVDALIGSYQTSQSLQAASMIGHGVLVPGSSVALSEGKGFLGLDLAVPADKVEVTVRDASGNKIYKIDLGSTEVGPQTLQWDGSTDSGETAPDGNYTFEVKATRGQDAVTATTLSFGMVGSVSTGSQGISLNVPGIGAVGLADVRQIL
jgi:flagellar basal-body rod modification protein FlgD